MLKQTGGGSQASSNIAPPRSAIADLSTPGPFEGVDFSLSAGDLAPEWPLETTDGKQFSFFHDYASGYTRRLLVGATPGKDDALIRSFVSESRLLTTNGVRSYVVLQKEEALVAELASVAPCLIDKDGQLAVSSRCR